MLDGLQEILFTLRQNKLRTLLTAFGVFWGIFMLVLLLGAGRGMQNGIYEDFGSDVLDFIIVWTGTTTTAYHGMPPGRAIRLTLEDIEAVRQQVPGIRLLSAASQVNSTSGPRLPPGFTCTPVILMYGLVVSTTTSTIGESSFFGSSDFLPAPLSGMT